MSVLILNMPAIATVDIAVKRLIRMGFLTSCTGFVDVTGQMTCQNSHSPDVAQTH
jgi:hypothetical protein